MAEQLHNNGGNHISVLKTKRKKKKLNPPGMQGSAAQWSCPFLLGLHHREGLSPQKVALQVERGAMMITLALQ